ncbi:pentatricopeptide repeat-containing protein [Tanacetum coccineum]|uniref:Pentatricopeptide repeat-containing protein n=1 Tax=Tanacetum coccineum TaxID=301880 RepID=A0ABQ5D8K2_9ASTR
MFEAMPVKSVVTCTAVISGYASNGDVEAARKMFDQSSKTVFNQMFNRCIITWTTMVSGLAVNGMCKEALALFNQMCVQGTKPDDVMFIAVLSACNHGGLVEEARSGDLDEAVRLTESMDMVPNAVIWGTLIGACKLEEIFQSKQTAKVGKYSQEERINEVIGLEDIPY